MRSLGDTFAHFAEIAVALAGFVGVVSAFAGRSRNYSTIERARTLAVGASAGSVLAGSLSYTTMSSGGFSSAISAQSAAIVSLLLTFGVMTPILIGAARALISKEANQPWVYSASLAGAVLLLGLFSFSILQDGDPLPLLAGFSIQLLVGFWMFMRLLLHSD